VRALQEPCERGARVVGQLVRLEDIQREADRLGKFRFLEDR
jgi:hypothetical protein